MSIRFPDDLLNGLLAYLAGIAMVAAVISAEILPFDSLLPPSAIEFVEAQP
jgi:hypothetical protein